MPAVHKIPVGLAQESVWIYLLEKSSVPCVYPPRRVMIARRFQRPPRGALRGEGRSAREPASRRRSRQDLIDAAARFARAASGSIDDDQSAVVSFEQLQSYFSQCNVFYCRSGDGTAAATSALKTIHGSENTAKLGSCTFGQLQTYFLETFIKDQKRIDRLEPVISGILKESRFKGSSRKGSPSCRWKFFANSNTRMPQSRPPHGASSSPSPDAEEALSAAASYEREDRGRRIDMAVKAANAEQQRRMSVEAEYVKQSEILRQENKKVTADAEKEQQRRVAEEGSKARRKVPSAMIFYQNCNLDIKPKPQKAHRQTQKPHRQKLRKS